MKINLIRNSKENNIIRGYISFDNNIIYTIENLDQFDEENSLIEEGVYTCKQHIYPNYGLCFKIFSDNREDIYIHNGNTDDEIKGNIILRLFNMESYLREDAKSGRAALDIMLNNLDKEFELEIRNEF